MASPTSGLPRPAAPGTPARRSRATRWSVRAADQLAGTLIRVGGIGTIVAVLTVLVFLLWVAAPLFQGVELGPTAGFPGEAGAERGPLRLGLDEYAALGWKLDQAGRVQAVSLADGRPCGAARPVADGELTAVGPLHSSGKWPCGFADGTVRLVQISVTTSDVATDQAPAEGAGLADGEAKVLGERLLMKSSAGKLRWHELALVAADPLVPAGGAAVRCLDYLSSTSGNRYAWIDATGALRIVAVKQQKNPATGQLEKKKTEAQVALETRPGREPRGVFFWGGSGSLAVLWDDGRLARYDVRKLEKSQLTEVHELVDKGRELTSWQLLPGRGTLLVGDADGRLGVWFPTRPDSAETSDGLVLVRARSVPLASEPLVGLATSARRRLAVVGTASGEAVVVNITTGDLLARASGVSGPAQALALAPKDDSVLVGGPAGLARLALRAPHPEATARALFGLVWYEGYEAPSHTWQSSSASDDFEPKLGFWPLVFGTLKATVYSLLFAVPIALAAALYTSEFMPGPYKSRIKPTIELMASLPSVVLGFLGALVVAPWVEQLVPELLAALATLPLTVLLGAVLWQMLPTRLLFQWSRYRFALIGLALAVGGGAALAVGPLVEGWLFGGDLYAWLDGDTRPGRALGGWLLLLLPPAGAGMALFLSRGVNPWLRRRLLGWTRAGLAPVEFVKFSLAVLGAVGLALAGAAVLEALGFDPRGSVVDSYVQRNALVVGAMMGFAIIPIIYTIAEDALSTVPQSLRSASLGAGATPWQTAVRVVIPVAMSGLFSAVMVGLGRAVGETMIVLMAAGNTPVTDWNVFSGFRTLSANIAVELPEAARDSTHYRTLFLAALVLFAMTFVINSLAEGVRQRFRRRAFEL